jgi:hypothetical protein
VTRRARLGIATAGSAAAFLVAFFLRLDAAYGPFHLSLSPSDWIVLWELWRTGQIAPDVVTEGMVVGAAAAAAPWVLLGLGTRRRAGP